MLNRLNNLYQKYGKQLIRYVIAGGVAFVVDFLLLWMLHSCVELELLLAQVISFSAGVVVTYLFSIYWVFDFRSVSNRIAEFSLFALINLVGLGFTILLIWLFAEKMGIHYLLSKVFTTVMVTLLNFIAKRLLLFSRR
jgi:putative flippase GtrA